MSWRTTPERWLDRRGRRGEGRSRTGEERRRRREEKRKACQAEGESDVQSEGEDYFSCLSVPVQGPEDENANSIPGDEGSPWGLCPAQGVLEAEETG